MLRLIRLFTIITLALALSVILYTAVRPARADTLDLSDAFSISTDDGLSLTLSEDGQVTALAMDGDPLPITPAPALWVRDMSAAGQVSEPNLVTNPGFEDGEADWRMGLQVGTDIALTDSVSHSGGWSLEMHGVQTESLGRATVIANPVDVTPGQRYRLSAYFLSSRGYVLGLDGTPPRRQDEAWRGLAWPNGIYLAGRRGGDGRPGAGEQLGRQPRRGVGSVSTVATDAHAHPRGNANLPAPYPEGMMELTPPCRGRASKKATRGLNPWWLFS